MKHRFGGTGAGEGGQICPAFFLFLAALTALSATLVQFLPITTEGKKLIDASE